MKKILSVMGLVALVGASTSHAVVDYTAVQTAALAEVTAVAPVAIAIVSAIIALSIGLKLIKKFGKG